METTGNTNRLLQSCITHTFIILMGLLQWMANYSLLFQTIANVRPVMSFLTTHDMLCAFSVTLPHHSYFDYELLGMDNGQWKQHCSDETIASVSKW